MTQLNDAEHHIIFTELTNKLECNLFKINTAPPSELDHLLDFFYIWERKCKGTTLPAWKDFNFEDFKGWHSRIRVMEIGTEILAPKHNIILGEIFATFWGKKTIYEQIQEGTPPTQKTIKKYYEYLSYIYKKHYSFNVGAIPKSDGSVLSTNWIELPLSQDGKNVTHLLSAISKTSP